MTQAEYVVAEKRFGLEEERDAVACFLCAAGSAGAAEPRIGLTMLVSGTMLPTIAGPRDAIQAIREDVGAEWRRNKHGPLYPVAGLREEPDGLAWRGTGRSSVHIVTIDGGGYSVEVRVSGEALRAVEAEGRTGEEEWGYRLTSYWHGWNETVRCMTPAVRS